MPPTKNKSDDEPLELNFLAFILWIFKALVPFFSVAIGELEPKLKLKPRTDMEPRM